jgi:adenosylmethionine-8-amino-7-oxononanoate aminotransferase
MLGRYAGRRLAPPGGTALGHSGLRWALRGGDLSSPPRSPPTYVLGGACSTLFDRQVLGRVLRPAAELQRRAVERLEAPALPPWARDVHAYLCPTLSVHTSVGLPPSLPRLVHLLGEHRPWPSDRAAAEHCDGDGGDGGDWFVSLQVEGASAVWAALDLGMQLQAGQPARTRWAVACHSYHGPPSSSAGAARPLWSKPHQLEYPAPVERRRRPGEARAAFHARTRRELGAFLDAHAHELGVLLCEPQWGSSATAQTWPPALLRWLVREARRRGVFVVCDEIMCGLGRHAQGPLFLSEAWGLEPDAVTFGKALGAGVYPIAGVLVREGRARLRAAGRSVMQQHTYAGSSELAARTAAEVLEQIPRWQPHAAAMGEVVRRELAGTTAAAAAAAGGDPRGHAAAPLRCYGHGLLQGGAFFASAPSTAEWDARREALGRAFVEECAAAHVLPYHVAGGFVLSPPMNVCEEELVEGLRRLRTAALAAVQRVHRE